MGRYEVTCGNVGTVYSGDDRAEADRVFDEYVAQSKRTYGRASGENVTMLERFPKGVAIILEWIGWLSNSESED